MTPEFCKHSLAVCVAIRTFINEGIITNEDSFTAIDTELFDNLINLANAEVII